MTSSRNHDQDTSEPSWYVADGYLVFLAETEAGM